MLAASVTSNPDRPLTPRTHSIFPELIGHLVVPYLNSAELEAETWLQIIAANPETWAMDTPHAEEA